MILPAPTSPAAWIVFRPMPPQPNTTTVEPGGTLARLTTEPKPAITPQLTRQTTSSGASLRIGMTLSSGSTAAWRSRQLEEVVEVLAALPEARRCRRA